jgi:hypothetical protein
VCHTKLSHRDIGQSTAIVGSTMLRERHTRSLSAQAHNSSRKQCSFVSCNIQLSPAAIHIQGIRVNRLLGAQICNREAQRTRHILKRVHNAAFANAPCSRIAGDRMSLLLVKKRVTPSSCAINSRNSSSCAQAKRSVSRGAYPISYGRRTYSSRIRRKLRRS